MSAKGSPGKAGWGGKVGKVLFWALFLFATASVVGWQVYQFDKDRRLAERSDPQMGEIRQIFDEAIEDGVASAEARGNYTISEQHGMEYVIRYTLPNGHFDYYIVSLDWEGRWFFSGGAGGEKSFIRDRVKVE